MYIRRIGCRFDSWRTHTNGELTAAACSTASKAAGILTGMGTDTSALRYLTWKRKRYTDLIGTIAETDIRNNTVNAFGKPVAGRQQYPGKCTKCCAVSFWYNPSADEPVYGELTTAACGTDLKSDRTSGMGTDTSALRKNTVQSHSEQSGTPTNATVSFTE